jgi:hypothetical protein
MLLEKHLTASKGLVVNLCFCRVAIEVTKNKWQKVKIEIGKESKKKIGYIKRCSVLLDEYEDCEL